MIALYLGGILMAIVVALVAKTFFFRGEAVPFVMELPNYRMPGVKSVAMLLWDKAKDFLQRAFTVIFLASLVVWFLQTFDLGFNMVEDSHNSILASLAGLIAPIFTLHGFGEWRVVTALITGFIAKESVVSTLTILFGGAAGITAVMAGATAASLLVFCLLYTPCVAAVASIRRELGGKWAALIVLEQCAVAWVVSLIVAGIGALL